MNGLETSFLFFSLRPGSHKPLVGSSDGLPVFQVGAALQATGSSDNGCLVLVLGDFDGNVDWVSANSSARTSKFHVRLRPILCQFSELLPIQCILSRFNHKCKCILLGFYVINQHKVMHNCEVEGKWYMISNFFFANKKTEKCGVQKYSTPWVNTL